MNEEIKEAYRLIENIVDENPRLYIINTQTWDVLLQKLQHMDRALTNARASNEKLRAKLKEMKK